MSKRFFGLTLSTMPFALCFMGATLLALSFPAKAQQGGKVARIGFLGITAASGIADRVAALRASLRELGYVEGKNIVIEFRWAEGRYDRLPELAAELVRLNVDVIVAQGTPGTLAAKRATATIPIVMPNTADAVASGIVASLAHPGGNITGTTFFNPEISAKRLQLLKEAFPRTRRVAVLANPDNPTKGPILQEMEISAKSLKLSLQQFGAREPNEFDSAFAAMAEKRVDAVTIVEDGIFFANVKAIADIASKKRLPSIGFLELPEAGGLMAYGVNLVETYRRAAYFVDKILKGTKPADLPVEQPTEFELVINLKTAKQIGITIPPNVLARADKVIR